MSHRFIHFRSLFLQSKCSCFSFFCTSSVAWFSFSTYSKNPIIFLSVSLYHTHTYVFNRFLLVLKEFEYACILEPCNMATRDTRFNSFWFYFWLVQPSLYFNGFICIAYTYRTQNSISTMDWANWINTIKQSITLGASSSGSSSFTMATIYLIDDVNQ